jgi:hypothetical protein
MQIPPNPCLPNPCISGLCVNRNSSFVCQCFPGFTGQRCEICDVYIIIYYDNYF